MGKTRSLDYLAGLLEQYYYTEALAFGLPSKTKQQVVCNDDELEP
jgi:hypothetical protein